MANETSPLNAEQIGFAKEKAKEVGTKALAYARTVANGNASIRVMALIGGFALVVDSLSSFLNNVLSFHWDSALINFYAMFIGLSAIIMESDKEAIPYATMLRAKLGKNFGIVRSVTGRGLFYGIAGTLEMSADSHRSTIIGGIVLAIGIAYIALGRIASDKLKALRTQEFPDRKIKSFFEKYDSDQSGRIEFTEFVALLKDMKIELGLQEAELIYMGLDRDMNHGLTLEEFQKFWSTSDEIV